jgi:hypothetical protein
MPHSRGILQVQREEYGALWDQKRFRHYRKMCEEQHGQKKKEKKSHTVAIFVTQKDPFIQGIEPAKRHLKSTCLLFFLVYNFFSFAFPGPGTVPDPGTISFLFCFVLWGNVLFLTSQSMSSNSEVRQQ